MNTIRLSKFQSALLSCITVLWLGLFFLAPLSHADTDKQSRPKIGLALSGGGARGAAHVGVLKALEELRIPIDYIAGTSMGSIIGGLYASGMTTDEIEAGIAAMDWEHIFNDAPPRAERSFRRKRDDDLYLVKAKMGLTDEGGIKFPSGAIQGQKFDLALRQLTMPVFKTSNFDQLYIPFRAVASDIHSGERVVIGSGDLATALRASMAVPGLFAATEIDGRLLVDGGITSNLPIEVVREMGADIVIAVDIGSLGAEPEEIANLFQITGQLVSILTRTNVQREIATLKNDDLLIVPDLGDFSSADFINATRIIPLGETAANAQSDSLKRLALSEQEYASYLALRAKRPLKGAPIVEFIKIENNSTISDRMIRDRLRQQPGKQLDRVQLEEDIGRIYGLEIFQTVHYQMVEEDGKTGLKISANARKWGPNYLQFGLELASDARGTNSYDLGIGYLRTGINPHGGELRVAAQAGEEPGVFINWYQPVDYPSRYFVDTAARHGSTNVNVFEDGERRAEFRVTESLLDFAVGREFDVYGEARIGFRYRSGDVDLKTGTPGWPEFSYDTGQVYARLSADRLDDYNFPGHGWLATLEYGSVREDYGADDDFDQVRLVANRFFTFGDGHVLGLRGKVDATTDGVAPIQDRFRLGGFLNLSGYVQDAISGQQGGVVDLIYYKQFKKMPFLSWYLGGSLEYGGVWEEKEDLFNDGIFSGSLYLGAETPIGPVYLGYGHAEEGYHSVFFYLGRPQFR